MNLNIKDDIPINYIELVLINKKIENNLYDIHFPDLQCSHILHKIQSLLHKKKPFHKNIVHYFYENIELVRNDNEESSSVFNTQFHYHDVYKDKILINYFHKQQLPSHSFPSTKNINTILDVKKTIMKISNNIYFNIDSIQYPDDEIYQHVYININLVKSSDIKHISETIIDYINMLV